MDSKDTTSDLSSSVLPEDSSISDIADSVLDTNGYGGSLKGDVTSGHKSMFESE